MGQHLALAVSLFKPKYPFLFEELIPCSTKRWSVYLKASDTSSCALIFIYTRCGPTVLLLYFFRRFVQSVLASPELLQLVENCPTGAGTLIARILNIITGLISYSYKRTVNCHL